MWFVPLAVMPLAFLLLVGGVSTPNLTAVGQEKLLEQELGPRGVLRITRNPVMWGIGRRSLADMVPNGDWASPPFFGTLAAPALLGSVLIDAKNAARRRRLDPLDPAKLQHPVRRPDPGPSGPGHHDPGDRLGQAGRDPGA